MSDWFRTPVNAIPLAAIVPTLFALLVHYNPPTPVHILFITYPPGINALFILVSFGVSGIYLSFFMVVLAALIARLRGWRPEGTFRLGRWAYPIIIGALVYQVLMLLNILVPTGNSSPKAALFNYDWLTLGVVVIIVIIGAIYYLVSRPQDRIEARSTTAGTLSQ